MRSRLVQLATVGLALAAAALAVRWWSESMRADELHVDGQGRVRAPEFRGISDWLNTGKPLTMAELRGQVVLVDFWTYCCINCLHIQPDLRYLEDKYAGQPFVVVGVHSGKFMQEKDPENIRQAILRHDIRHPVAVDSDYETWSAFGVRAWPTLALIDPEGYVIGMVSGEGHREDLDTAIGHLLEMGRQKGTLGKPLTFKREISKAGVLEFPGKVLADPRKGRLFIADTGHNRIVVTGLEGTIQQVIGSGKPGLDEGSFRGPQGMALSEDGATLYVADTENHAIRAVILQSGEVKTIAGTGKQGFNYRADGPGPQTALSSPWDLARVGEKLYIAMAGTHQIWVMDLATQRVWVFAGTGGEGATDGPNARATFAQPSGLATDGKTLYVADSEASSIRAIDLMSNQTRTLAGSGELFGFGLRDGPGKQALFQHPLGVALYGGTLLVADTFNSVIRSIDTQSGAVETWPGEGDGEGALKLYEPGGLCVAGDRLYIADTNHHRVLEVQIATRGSRELAAQPQAQSEVN